MNHLEEQDFMFKFNSECISYHIACLSRHDGILAGKIEIESPVKQVVLCLFEQEYE